MSGRRQAREYALQALFAVDVGAQTGPHALTSLWQQLVDETEEPLEPVTPSEIEFAQALVQGVLEERAELDPRIEAASTNWRLPRMPSVDRNILRLGAYELVHRPDIPVSVAINEAIELAKKYGGPESRAFVNGILDRIAADVGRGGRRGRAT